MTDNRTTELLPCPFCGGEADEYEGDYGNGVYCMMCGAMVGEPIHLEYMTTKRVSIDEAIAAWNSRAERTCEFKPFRSDTNEEGERQGICSVCSAYMHEQFCFCPNCGCKVVDA